MVILIAFLSLVFAIWLMYEAFSCLGWLFGIIIIMFLLSLLINYLWIWLPIIIILLIIAVINEYRSRKK